MIFCPPFFLYYFLGIIIYRKAVEWKNFGRFLSSIFYALLFLGAGYFMGCKRILRIILNGLRRPMTMTDGAHSGVFSFFYITSVLA